ncbi:NosD domain-containing protein [Roseimicrobium gellanilyticum]|uniref:NosD domain-containing protein n=1 Tax=Roseimicrobium gellanilyticum TaxID=748857 RepID=UPI0011BDF862|nr:NosD domain-containing protein [Roseimicrobium gellanilyticum]
MASDPYAAGNTISQDVNVTSFATTTTSTTTIEQLFRLYEEGMEGWDVQASLLVPGLDRWMDVFLIGGYYSFDNQPFGPQTGGTGNVEGWKAGVEVRPVPAVVLNATWYEDERYVGSDWLYGLRLEIPFEMGDLGDGKGFWDRVGESFTPRRRHLAERLVEPVRRQNEAIKIGNETEDQVDVNTSVKRVTKVSITPRRIVMQDDVVFVNNGGAVGNGIEAGSASGTGTAEQPVDTLQAGADLAVANSIATNRLWHVYTQGGVDYTTGAIIPAGGSVKFIGSGTPFVGMNGKVFGTGASPTLAGAYINSLVGGNYVGVFGYNIQNAAINLWNFQTVEIIGNTLPGSFLQFIDPTFLTVENNTISYNPICIAGIVVSVHSGNTQATIENNTIVGYAVDNGQFTDKGIAFYVSDTASLTASVTHNTITGFRTGIWSQTHLATASMNATITGNTVSGALKHGINIYNVFGTTTASITDNIINNSPTGILLEDYEQVGHLNITALGGNEIRDSTSAGIHVDAMPVVGDASITVNGFDGNLISGTPAGAHVRLEKSGTSILSVLGTLNNTATPTPNPDATGVTLDVEGTPTLNFLLNGVLINTAVDVP